MPLKYLTIKSNSKTFLDLYNTEGISPFIFLFSLQHNLESLLIKVITFYLAGMERGSERSSHLLQYHGGDYTQDFIFQSTSLTCIATPAPNLLYSANSKIIFPRFRFQRKNNSFFLKQKLTGRDWISLA